MPDAIRWNNSGRISSMQRSHQRNQPGKMGGDLSAWWKQGGPGNSTEGFTYAKIGAFVEGFEFDWKRWRQPPGLYHR